MFAPTAQFHLGPHHSNLVPAGVFKSYAYSINQSVLSSLIVKRNIIIGQSTR